MLFEEAQYLVVYERQVGRHHKLDVLPGCEVSPFRILNDELNQFKVKERLPTLEFDFYLLGGRPEDQVERPTGRLPRHVVFRLVRADPRDLAVVAGVVAAQGNDEDM